MIKKVPAFMAALLITAAVGLVMLGIGGAAYINTNNLPVLNKNNTSVLAAATSAPAQASQTPTQSVSASSTQAQLDAYKAQLAQAIQRINDANTQLQNLQSQLAQDNAALNDAAAVTQQYQNILTQLAQRGLINIDSNGNITVNGRTGGDFR